MPKSLFKAVGGFPRDSKFHLLSLIVLSIFVNFNGVVV